MTRALVVVVAVWALASLPVALALGFLLARSQLGAREAEPGEGRQLVLDLTLEAHDPGDDRRRQPEHEHQRQQDDLPDRRSGLVHQRRGHSLGARR